MLGLLDRVWMNRVYGISWNVFPPVNSLPVQREESVNVGIQNLERWTDFYQTTIEVGTNEVLVLHRWSLVALVPGPNPLWVGTGLREVPPEIFYGRFRWTVIADRNQIADQGVRGNQTEFDYAPTLPNQGTPTQYNGMTKLRRYGKEFGDAPLIIGPGMHVMIKMETIGDTGIGGDPPPDYPITLNGELSGYRIPYYPANKLYVID